MVARSVADGKPLIGDEGEGAVPMNYGDTSLGAIWVQGMRSDGVDGQALMEVLWRLASEAALVLSRHQPEQRARKRRYRRFPRC